MYSSNVMRGVGVVVCWLGVLGAFLVHPTPGAIIILTGTVIYVGGEIIHHIDSLKYRS